MSAAEVQITGRETPPYPGTDESISMYEPMTKKVSPLSRSKPKEATKRSMKKSAKAIPISDHAGPVHGEGAQPVEPEHQADDSR